MKNVCNYSALTGKNVKSVDALIADAIKGEKTMREKIQVACIGILIHAEKNGDWTKAKVLVDGLSGATNKEQLVLFFAKFGGLTFDKDGFTGWSGAEHIRQNFNDAKAKAWWEMKKAPNPYAGFDILTAVAKQVELSQKHLKTAQKLEDEGKVEEATAMRAKQNIPTDFIRELNALISKHAA